MVGNIGNHLVNTNELSINTVTLFYTTCYYLHSDETGIRVEKQAWQLWTWCTPNYVYYHVDKRRSYAVIEENLGINYEGVVVHDCYSAQNKTVAGEHQLCLAHFFRDLNFAIEKENCKWSQTLLYFLRNIRRIREIIWDEQYCPSSRETIIKGVFEAFKQTMETMPSGEEGFKYYRRVQKHQDKFLTFLKYQNLPSENNEAERAIRNAKIHKKVSGCFRNSNAAHRYAVIMSWTETAKRLGQSALSACLNIFNSEFNLIKT